MSEENNPPYNAPVYPIFKRIDDLQTDDRLLCNFLLVLPMQCVDSNCLTLTDIFTDSEIINHSSLLNFNRKHDATASGKRTNSSTYAANSRC